MLLVTVCTLALFFFPVAQGSFQATHGPVTTFIARQAFLILIFSIVAAAVHLVSVLGVSVVAGDFSAEGKTASLMDDVHRYFVLRC